MYFFLIYMFKSAICLILFYISYKVFLSNETFFRFNRSVLLFGTIVCFTLPAIKLNLALDNASVLHLPIAYIEQSFDITDSLEATDQTIQNNNIIIEADKAENQVNPYIILLILYIAGGLVSLLALLKSFSKMYCFINKGKKFIRDNYTIVVTNEKINPFSWGRYIVISKEDFFSDPTEILIHESEHIKHHHSFDLLFVEFLLLFQWFNPAIWLIKRELKDIHEYQADLGVIKAGIDATKYQLLLVKKAVGASSYTLANSFNHSKIKKRITMMLKRKSNKLARLKLAFTLPLAAIAVYSFAKPNLIPEMEQKSKVNNLSVEKEQEFSFPLKSSFEITGEYGMRTRRSHKGIDLKGQGKDTIYAVFSGKVVTSELLVRAYGNYIVIEHENGYKTCYGHNSENFVSVGQSVKAGQPIGITGSTGRSVRDHLHFEIRKNGEAVNPAEIIDFKNRTLISIDK